MWPWRPVSVYIWCRVTVEKVATIGTSNMAIVTFVLLLLVCLVVPSQGLLGQESLRVLRPTAIIPGRPHLPIGELRYPFPPAFNLETSRKIPQVSLRPPLMDIVEASSSQLLVDGSSHYLVRIVFLRALAFVYFVAFLVAYHQRHHTCSIHAPRSQG